MAKHAQCPVRLQALAGNDEHAAPAGGMGSGEKRVERAMGLLLGAMVKIDLALDPELAASQLDQRALIETRGDSVAEFGLGRRPARQWPGRKRERPASPRWLGRGGGRFWLQRGRRRWRSRLLAATYWFDFRRHPAPELGIVVVDPPVGRAILCTSHRREGCAASAVRGRRATRSARYRRYATGR